MSRLGMLCLVNRGQDLEECDATKPNACYCCRAHKIFSPIAAQAMDNAKSTN